MITPNGDMALTMLESICAHSHRSAVLVGGDGQVAWVSGSTSTVLPDCFSPGCEFRRLFDEKLEFLAEGERYGASLLPSVEDGAVALPSKLVRRRGSSPHEAKIYRYDVFPVPPGSISENDAGEQTHVIHSFVDVSHQRKFEEDFIQNLCQLTSMKEIVDILYEPVSTQDVIHIILVGVTCQMGLGFNRAFFLQVKGNQLKGRIGIGPSDPEEANEIWSCIAACNFTSLREVYEDLILQGGIRDFRTQELSVRLEFDLPALSAEAEENEDGLAYAIKTGKPRCLQGEAVRGENDERLFGLLQTDCMAVVPLSVQGELAGVIIADNFITRQSIADVDLNALKTFAGYAAMALERSRLYEDLQATVSQLKSANERLKKNQEKLLQVEKLSAVGELAACVSHEIRTPLVAIGGLARSLLQDPIEDPSARDSLEMIGAEVSRLERFLGETLDFVKPKPADECTVDLQEEIRTCLATFKTEISESKIELQLRLLERPILCWMDPALLRRSLANLFKNAVEAMAEGGTLYVSLSRSGLFAVIRVGDTGAGIPSSVRSRIFDPYFTTKPGGTGLGLAIASQSIRRHGGRLELDSGSEFRTMFKLMLPLEAVEPDRSESKAAYSVGDETYLTRRLS